MSADQLVPVLAKPDDLGQGLSVGSGGVLNETSHIRNPTEDSVLVLSERCLHTPLWITSENEIPTYVLAILYIVFGVLYTLFGYRCFKTVMFLTGFIFGSVLVYLICIQEALFSTYGNASIALSAGLMFGLITMMVQYVGLFVLGFHSGILLSLAGLAVASQTRYAPSSVWLTFGILMASGILFALLNLHWQKGLTILGTAVYGGAIQAASCDYMVERFEMVRWIWDSVARVSNYNSLQHCWFSWFILGLWPLATITGLCIQCGVTGLGIHHIQMVPVKKSRNKNAQLQQPRTKEQQAELKQKKYRYLYQIRTAHGDIISQNYVQALQNKVIPKTGTSLTNGESSTLQSDSTHITILPGESGLIQDDKNNRDSFGSRYR